MNITVAENYSQMSKKAAEVVEQVILDNSSAVLGLATGTTPIGLYKELISDFKRGKISFKNVKAVNLDEYIGLPKTHVQSYAFFMKSVFFDHIDIDPSNTSIPDGMAENLDAECARYTRLLKGMKRDMQLLGLGSNGHIGFNEPGTPFDSTTYVVNLTSATISDNSRLFGSIEEVPKKAITMGISEIMSAGKILMLASGRNKADAVYSMINGRISEECPASVLQRHPDVTVILGRDAASLL